MGKNRVIKIELNKMIRNEARFEMFLEDAKDCIKLFKYCISTETWNI